MKMSADLKDMMSYQLNSFQRSQIENKLNIKEEEEENENIENIIDTTGISPPPTPTVTLMPLSLCSGKGVKTSISPSDSCHCNSSTQYYCAECERETKKSRTIRFGSGGDVIIDKSKSYANFFAGDNINEESSSSKCFTVSINVPTTFDLTTIRNHRLNISISISENKNKIVPESDYSFIFANRKLLAECGWYYERMNWQESIRILKSTPIGTFILRDSSDPHFLFSLSAQTESGPISSRIFYSNHKFRLDASDKISEYMPTFSSILTLVEYYIKYGLVKNTAGRQVWVDATGRTFSPVHLTKPKRKTIGSLQHLSRLSVNKILPNINPSTIPPRMKSYLQAYPFTF